jgi:hypothetical protein
VVIYSLKIDVSKLSIINNFEDLDENLSQINYVNDLADVF